MSFEETKCPNCGSPDLKVIPGSGKAHCNSCDSDFLFHNENLNRASTSDDKIEGIIEYTVTDREIQKLFLKYAYNHEPFIPLDFLNETRIISRKKYCVAAYRFECDYSTKYQYEIPKTSYLKVGLGILGGIVKGLSGCENETDDSDEDDYVNWKEQKDNYESSTTVYACGNKKVSTVFSRL